MKIIKFIKHDVNEGIFRYWKRYLYIILISCIACIAFGREIQYCLSVYDGGWSPLEYGIHEFFGRYPYIYDPDLADSFVLPFEWIVIYLALALCIGSYISDDMQGFGVLMMVKSRQRYLWWCSKCIWAVLVNIIFFSLIWLVNCSFAWILKGDIRFEKNELLLEVEYGGEIVWTPVGKLLILTMVMPLLAGIVQSLFQMLGTIFLGSLPTVIIISGFLVLTAYNSNYFLWHGYAMVSRYYMDEGGAGFRVLNYHFGMLYCGVTAILLVVTGYIAIHKKDILYSQT